MNKMKKEMLLVKKPLQKFISPSNYLQCRVLKTQPISLKFVLNDSVSQELHGAVKIFKIQQA